MSNHSPKIISLDQFKKDASLAKSGTEIKHESDEKLSEAGKEFRVRFAEAIAKMELEFNTSLIQAPKSSDVKVKINVSSVLKIAKSSPLTAYSELHRAFVKLAIDDAKRRCDEAIKGKFKEVKARPTIEDLQKRLTKERHEHAAALSKLASQKMTEYLTSSRKM